MQQFDALNQGYRAFQIYRLQVAGNVVQETPGRAGTGNLEYAGNEAAAMVCAADVEVGAAAEEGEDFVPLAGCQFQISHAVNDNTKCQHGLGVGSVAELGFQLADAGFGLFAGGLLAVGAGFGAVGAVERADEGGDVPARGRVVPA